MRQVESRTQDLMSFAQLKTRLWKSAFKRFKNQARGFHDGKVICMMGAIQTGKKGSV